MRSRVEQRDPRFLSVFFSSRKAALISSLFALAVAALLYIVYREAEEAAHIDLPTGQADVKTPHASAGILTAPREVLVLNSYHVGQTWSDNETAGIIETLRKTPANTSYDIEYLDCKRHPRQEHFGKVRDLLKLKYGGKEIPVVVAVDNPALEFAVKNRALLFPRASIVFCGINDYQKTMLQGQENITGLAEALNAVDTLGAALRLHPQTREVLVLHDYTSTGLATRREAENQMQGLSGRISFRFTEEVTKQELTQLLIRLPKDSLVLALAYSVFKDGEVITHEEVARLLSANAPVPVYGVHQERLGYGIVGGSLLSGRLHGAQAARVALKILSGTPASAIPVDMNPPTRMMFDYNQLVRFGVPVQALPDGSIVVNRPIPFISSHFYLVVSTLLVIIILTSGIIILGFNMHRRELVEDDLRKSKEELETRVSERTAELHFANEQLQWELIERKKADQALRKSEQRLQLHIRQTPLAVIEWDTEFQVIGWNPAAEKIFGHSAAEAYGRHAAFIVPAVARPHVDRVWSELLLRKGGERSTNENITKDGRTILCEWYNTPLVTADGSVIGVASLVQDVTGRKRAEEALRQREAALNESQRLAHIGSWDWDAVKDVIWWSDEYYHIYGFVLNAPPPNYEEHKKAYTAESAARLDAAVKRAMETGEPYEVDLELAQPTPDTHWIVARGEARRDVNGKIGGLRGTAQNITERKNAEREIQKAKEELEQRFRERTRDVQKKGAELQESQMALMNIVEDLNEKTAELEQANSRLQELDQLKSMFIASMSHELRTPLNSIIGFSSITLNEWTGPLTTEQKENLAAVLRSGKHLLSLINDVIDVSKIEAGKIESIAEDFDAGGVVREAVETLKKEIEDKGLALKVSAPRLALRGDRRRLLQCLLNLLSNAVKYTARGSIKVSAELSADGSMMDVAVEDTGTGIRENDLARLFLPFVRFQPPLDSVVPGTGLGLYLTKKLVREILKGDILVRSVYGAGSRFTLRVPAAVQGRIS